MATATPKTKVVTKTVEVEEPDGIVLHLTDEEAQTLHYITRRIGGDPRGPRGHADSIGLALYEAGVSYAVSVEAVDGMRFPSAFRP